MKYSTWWAASSSCGDETSLPPQFEMLRLETCLEGEGAESPRQLDKFADLVERTVVTLKENKQNSDLEGGDLYAIVLEKIPQSLLSQYYRWIKEKGKQESL